MTIYEELGVRPVINAAATLTAVGGSRMPPAVLDAMADAAGSYVDMHELQAAAGRRLAELTRNEAAYVTSGCAAALVLATLACATKGDPAAIERMPDGDGLPTEVVMHCSHRIPYDRALRLAGARIVQIGDALQTWEWELQAAIGLRTAAVLYVAGDHLDRDAAIGLPATIAIAHERDVPVIVDAAAQLPPASNLWRFTRDLGADVALFSGGKGLRGPQSSGLVVGTRTLVEAIRANGSPHQRLARALKVGKEEIAGLLRAVEIFLALDHDALLARYEATVASWVATFESLPGVRAVRDFPNEVGQPTPRVRIDVDSSQSPTSVDELAAALWDGSPRILALREDRSLYLTPDTLDEDEAEIVAERITSVLDPARSA